MTPAATHVRPSAGHVADDLAREVYCVLGVPIDAVTMDAIPRTVAAAVDRAAPFLISTPNINFLVTSLSDSAFRESLLQSDLCTADGVPVVWIARLMGLPIAERVAGSDIFETLKHCRDFSHPLRVFLFGGAEGVARAAAHALNTSAVGVRCVGSLCPGFGTVDDLSEDTIIESINASHAQFLAVALGAQKGQTWLQRNHHRLRVPVRVHLGATINFQADTVRRAPLRVRDWGLEWLWRIKEEPHLWRRYGYDGLVLLRLLVTQVLPLLVSARVRRAPGMDRNGQLVVEEARVNDAVRLTLRGAATARNAGAAADAFRSALGHRTDVVLDIAQVSAIDARFLGLVLMLRKQAIQGGSRLQCVGASKRIRRQFRLNGAAFLIDDAAEGRGV